MRSPGTVFVLISFLISALKSFSCGFKKTVAESSKRVFVSIFNLKVVFLKRKQNDSPRILRFSGKDRPFTLNKALLWQNAQNNSPMNLKKPYI